MQKTAFFTVITVTTFFSSRNESPCNQLKSILDRVLSLSLGKLQYFLRALPISLNKYTAYRRTTKETEIISENPPLHFESPIINGNSTAISRPIPARYVKSIVVVVVLRGPRITKPQSRKNAKVIGGPFPAALVRRNNTIDAKTNACYIILTYIYRHR